MHKKIGILTYFWGHNHGTFLQAYSMLCELRRRFPDYQVEIINCRARKVSFKPGRRHINLKRLVDDYRYFRLWSSCQEEYLPQSPNGIVSVDYEQSSDYIRRQDYSLIVVGADTALEVLPAHRQAHQVPVYWLPADLDCPKVMFSVSAGSLTIDKLDESSRLAMSQSLNSFDLVGVRDTNAYDLMLALGIDDKSKLEITPDPAFKLQIDYGLIESCVRRNNCVFDKPTVAINLPWHLPLCQRLVNHYRTKDFKVFLLGYDYNSELGFPRLSPLEWAGVHRYFALEITDRFHGTLFSLKNGTPVVAVNWEERKRTSQGLSKTYSLLNAFDMQANHIDTARISNMNKVCAVSDAAIEGFNRPRVLDIVKDMQRQYDEFMEKVATLLA